ncbi:MAG: (d)CMP kinase, partial [Candidatus Dormibacterales bacterium]
MIVAIDGPAGSGKSAVGRRVAEALGLPFVDSGLFYRAVACLVLGEDVDPSDAEGVTAVARRAFVRVEGRRVWADGAELSERVYGPGIDEGASRVAAVPGVRAAMLGQQRRLGRTGVVMAGRDIGTVVFPQADHKFFLTAGLEERARRRSLQYERRGGRVDMEEVVKDVAARDRA